MKVVASQQTLDTELRRVLTPREYGQLTGGIRAVLVSLDRIADRNSELAARFVGLFGLSGVPLSPDSRRALENFIEVVRSSVESASRRRQIKVLEPRRSIRHRTGRS